MTVIETSSASSRPVSKRAKPQGKKTAPASVPAPSSGPVESPSRDLLVPLDRLVLSEANVRKVHHDEGLAEIAALIESQGLLQRLCVVAAPDERFAVIAGGRRLRAMQLLVERGTWTPSQPVECRVFEEARAVEVSLAENSAREAMHPADQMEAFRRLIDEGLNVAQVAGRFGVSALTVERRLRLARIAPRFIDMYRADEIEPEPLQALSLIEDPDAQEILWEGLSPYDRSAWRIRSLIMSTAIPADSRLARFVGLERYEAEGGTVRRDLFSSPDDLEGVFLDNPEVLQTLAMEKLREQAATVQAEGWSWVTCSMDADMTALRGHGRVDRQRREPSTEETRTIEALSVEQQACSDAYDKHQEEGDPEDGEFEAIERRMAEALEAADDRLEAGTEALWQWSPEQLAMAGAVVRIDSRGRMVIDRGLVRPQDRTKERLAGSAGDEGQPHHATESIVNAKPEFSERLMRDLTAHRTAAIQAALVQNPRIALVTLVHRMAETVFGLYGPGEDVVKVTVRTMGDDTLGQEASGYASSAAAQVLGTTETQWGDRLPGSPAALFQWLLAKTESTLLELLAYCTARSVNAVVGRRRNADQSDALAQALGLDMADWWTPTAKTYLDSVSKAKALEAVREATGVDRTQATAGMKKAEVVAYCASQLEGTRWLPSPLRRTVSGDVEAEAEANAADDNASD